MIDPRAVLIRADDEFETAWRQRNWSAFIYLWLRNSVIVTIGTFVLVGVIGIIGVEVGRIYYLLKGVDVSMASHYAGLWNYTSWFTVTTAIMCLFSGLLFMIVKEVCGDFRTR